MLSMILKRVLALAVMLLLVSVLVFGLVYLVPGNVEQALLGSRPTTEEVRAALRERYLLDEPLFVQYLAWLRSALGGDLGMSIVTREPVTEVLLSRLGVTVPLAAYALVIALAVGVPLGLLAGGRRGRGTDQAISLLSTIAFAAPPFAVGLALVYASTTAKSPLPTFGAGDPGLNRILHLTLPALTIATAQAAVIIRQMRATTSKALGSEFTRFARARGVSPWRIWTGYVLRNASLPVVTGAGLLLASAFGGAIIVENVFGLAGVGNLLLTSIQAKDIPVIQGVTLTITVLVVLAMLIVDVVMMLVDPRLRYRRSQA